MRARTEPDYLVAVGDRRHLTREWLRQLWPEIPEFDFQVYPDEKAHSIEDGCPLAWTGLEPPHLIQLFDDKFRETPGPVQIQRFHRFPLPSRLPLTTSEPPCPLGLRPLPSLTGIKKEA